MNYNAVRKTVRILLTDEESLEEYDTILNTTGVTIVKELRVDEKSTSYEGETTTTTTSPYLIVTYMEKEIL
jgi:hypothetical protein